MRRFFPSLHYLTEMSESEQTKSTNGGGMLLLLPFDAAYACAPTFVARFAHLRLVELPRSRVLLHYDTQKTRDNFCVVIFIAYHPIL
jgi:hypothetical protein